jgi:hypothetical protein
MALLLIHDFCCFKHKFGFVTPCGKISLKTPTFPDGKGQTNDASEKFVCPN